jgi:hypothetical protein
MAGWFPLGDAQLLVVSDGVLRLDAGAVFGLTPRVMWEPFAGSLDEEHRLGMGLNCLLVRSQGKLILVETGVGSKATRLPGRPLGPRRAQSESVKGSRISRRNSSSSWGATFHCEISIVLRSMETLDSPFSITSNCRTPTRRV